MTTATQQQHNSGLGIFAGLVLLLLVTLTGVALLYPSGAQTPTVAAIKPIPQIQYQPHSVEKHGADALAIRKCLHDKGGANEIWRSSDRKTHYLWCQLPDGRWGFMAVVQDAVDRLWYESTAFIKGDGTKDALLNYMRKFGTRYNGPYPWE
jgi:putative hemolysin